MSDWWWSVEMVMRARASLDYTAVRCPNISKVTTLFKKVMEEKKEEGDYWSKMTPECFFALVKAPAAMVGNPNSAMSRPAFIQHLKMLEYYMPMTAVAIQMKPELMMEYPALGLGDGQWMVDIMSLPVKIITGMLGALTTSLNCDEAKAADRLVLGTTAELVECANAAIKIVDNIGEKVICVSACAMRYPDFCEMSTELTVLRSTVNARR